MPIPGALRPPRNNLPWAHNTHLGWIVYGQLPRHSKKKPDSFQKTTMRRPDGAYTVTLPLKKNADFQRRQTKSVALQRLQAAEEKCKNDKQLENAYSMQNRPKWTNNKHNLQVNDVVVTKDKTLPPTAWKPGRVTTTYPGKDKKIVVDVRTKDGVKKRPFTELALLPTTPYPPPQPLCFCL